MSTTTPDGPPVDADGTATRSVRDRILDAASELFYARGIRAISADKIIELSGITKVTFYRYFRAKDVLVVAYLERQAAWERGALDGLRRSSSDDAQALRRFAAAIGAESCKPGFRGCAFINAAAEYPDPEGPVRKVVAQHRGWYRATFAGMLGRIGVNDPARAAEQVMMLRDGAMVTGSLDEPSRVGGALERAIFAVIDASLATRTAG